MIEASIGKDNPCGIDLVVGEHDEFHFACRITHFFQPTVRLELTGKGAIRQRFQLGRKQKRERTEEREETEMWAGILGVRADATPEEIHQAYISKMRMYHPDLTANQGESVREIAAWKARELNMAYSVARKHMRQMK
ncbi:J domain-containing protein [Methylocystis sp. JAN1]|uniref:J domain-containing protein n=1 Tax=Methylocystis sp. JAN1 TaxID=3397211 RepID=UPI003FA2FA10